MLEDKLKNIQIGDLVGYLTAHGQAHGVCVGWSDTAGIGARFFWQDRTREKFILIDSDKRVPLEAVCSRRRDRGCNQGVITWDTVSKLSDNLT